MNKTLCAYPWRSAAIRPNGLTIPCCRYPHISDKDSYVTSDNPRLSEHWINLRKDMLNGEKISGCESCYQDERDGLYSMRQESLTKFIPINEELLPVEQLEISFSNLCNLACAHCSSFFSTKWYTEDVKFGRIEKLGVVESQFDFQNWDLSKLKELKIIGGEPFMEQKRFINLLSKLNLSNISLQICTNGTIIPNEELKNLILKCKKVYLCVSLDGLHTTNDWYRWPSKFTEIIDNMKLFETWNKNNNIIYMVHHVINAINVFELEDFVNYIYSEFPLWKIEWDWIRWPNWQELNSLPDDIKQQLTLKFSYLSSIYVDNNNIPNPYKVAIERLNETPNSNWQTLKNEVKRLSSERNLNFLKMVPSYKKIWNNYE